MVEYDVGHHVIMTGLNDDLLSSLSKCLTSLFLSFVQGGVASLLVSRFGCRRVAIGGGILGTTAFLLSALSPNVDILILLYGVLGGKLLHYILVYTHMHTYIHTYIHTNIHTYIHALIHT